MYLHVAMKWSDEISADNGCLYWEMQADDINSSGSNDVYMRQ